MKKVLPVFFLFIALNSWAQKSRKPNPIVQKESYNKALNFLEKSDNTKTMRHLYYALSLIHI